MSENVADEHPVWKVYDLHRTARLNAKYYFARVTVLDRQNSGIEFLLAFAASSTVASLWIWTTAEGVFVWNLLGIVTAALAIAKPILKLTDKIKKTEKAQNGYEALDHDLYRISVEIANARAYTPQLRKQFLNAIDRLGALIKEQPERAKDKKLIKRLTEEVNSELPPESFFVPDTDS